MADQQPRNATRIFIGFTLMTIGALWLAFCGMCALGVLANFVVEGAATLNAIPSLLLVVAITGVSASIGYAIFAAGLRRWRS